MKINKKFSLCLIIASLLLVTLAFGQETQIRGFTKNDKVLIFAPHPDDEAIGTAGVIERALKAGAKVKVVCFTSGDHNEFTFIYNEKRLVFRKGEFIYLGEGRRKETLAGMKSLGLGENDVAFLGYPDFGTMEILTKYWGNTRPFKDFLTRISKVPYKEALSPGAPYVGESILKDILTLIFNFKPTLIFVSHPFDTNRDHRALYLFTRVALWDLEGKIAAPEVFPYPVHIIAWPRPRGYHPELGLEPSELLKDSGIYWQKLELTQDEVSAKHDAIALYKTQVKPMPPYLFSFARKNELFGDCPVIKLSRQPGEDLVWQDVRSAGKAIEKEEGKAKISGLSYARTDKELFIKIDLKRKIDKNFGVSVFLLGYSKDKEFASMPKIRIAVGIGGLSVKDKKQTLFIKGTKLKYQGRSMIIKIPFSSLANPAYILASARTSVKDLTFDETGWRVLDLDHINEGIKN